jgi:7-alpha-hydroxysteroid dehydrogenase
MTQTTRPTHARGVDEFRLDGYVALVTGAGRGIGAGIARAYAEAGSDVALVARTRADLEEVAADARNAGRSALVRPTDVTDVSQAARIIERTVAEYGRLDILVNNAGGAMPGAYLDATAEALDEAFHFNVASPFELIRSATPFLLESGRASVINVTSRMDSQVARGLVIYGTVKAALAQMTRLLAQELAPRVRVNGIAPSVVATDGLRAVLDDELRRRMSRPRRCVDSSRLPTSPTARDGSPHRPRAPSPARSSRSMQAPKRPPFPTTPRIYRLAGSNSDAGLYTRVQHATRPVRRFRMRLISTR